MYILYCICNFVTLTTKIDEGKLPNIFLFKCTVTSIKICISVKVVPNLHLYLKTFTLAKYVENETLNTVFSCFSEKLLCDIQQLTRVNSFFKLSTNRKVKKNTHEFVWVRTKNSPHNSSLLPVCKMIWWKSTV